MRLRRRFRYRSVTLRSALKGSSPLQSCVENGLDAFLAQDKSLIEKSERPRVVDSLDLDAATRAAFPDANRWDYILSISRSVEVIGIEPHTAKDSEISTVRRKKENAQTFLVGHLHSRYRVLRWYWVSHGRTQFSVMEKAQRQLAKSGIKYTRVLKSLDE